MRFTPLLLALIPALFALPTKAQTASPAHPAAPTSYVNPFAGSGGGGGTTPEARTPFGMMGCGPDTRQWGTPSGTRYDAADAVLQGLSPTWGSPGTPEARQAACLLMPVVGRPDLRYMGEKEREANVAFASPLDAASQVAMPGYYAVNATRYGVRAEMTATHSTALLRFTFPDTTAYRGFVLDGDYGLRAPAEGDVSIVFVSRQEVLLTRRLPATRRGDTAQVRYVVARFERPYDAYNVRHERVTLPDARATRCKAEFGFELPPHTPLLVQVAVSAQSADHARSLLHTEQPSWNFDSVRHAAHAQWQAQLAQVEATTADSAQRTLLYTALYRVACTTPATCMAEALLTPRPLRPEADATAHLLHEVHRHHMNGEATRTQDLCDSLLHGALVRPGVYGYRANDVSGDVSAWYAQNVLGLCPVVHEGRTLYSLGRPLLNVCTLVLPSGRRLTVHTKNNNYLNRHVRGASFNGHKLWPLRLTRTEVLKGGMLEVRMEK